MAITGLKPREFTWVIDRRLAVSQRIGGHGFQHRRVRREEELTWLEQNGINAVLSLLPGNQNLSSYQEMGFRVMHVPLPELFDVETDLPVLFDAIDTMLEDPKAVVLLHRDIIDDTIAGLLAGYLVHADFLGDPIKATAIVQEILGRPLGPLARSMIPT